MDCDDRYEFGRRPAGKPRGDPSVGQCRIRENDSRPSIELQPAPPLVYLIAPALCFHPATEILERYLVHDMENIA